MNRLVVGLVAGFLALVGTGCAELRDDLPPAGGTIVVHKSGWIDPTSSYFHGNAIRDSGWDMSLCKKCHGQRYDGGTTGISCLTCHTNPTGPEYCTTCHGGANNAAPPRDLYHNTDGSSRGVGAHQRHLMGGSISGGMPCSSCHIVPAGLYVVGHVDSQLPAEVPLNSPIGRTVTNEPSTTDYDPTLPLIVPDPLYDAGTISCGNSYCHGSFKNGNFFAPIWNDATGTQMACGTCHGDVTKPTLAERARPKNAAEGGTHPSSTSCSNCHGDVVNSSLSIIDKTKHINGKLNVSGQERDF
jgi:predicted CxxxxCH...CXXCH cytochrome family protein